MSFRNLNKDELAQVAEFFVVDVEAADPEKGPTKKELITALASGDEPVTWEQYNDIYLKAQEGPAPKQPVPEPVEAIVDTVETAKESEETPVLIKYERHNPTYEVVGYTFYKRHPFLAVPPDVAEYLVLHQEGFRVALPSEVTDYYN